MTVAVLAGDAILRQLLVAVLRTEQYTVLAPVDLDAPLPTPPRVALLDPWTATPAQLTRLREHWGHTTAIIALVDQVADAARVPAVASLVKPFELDDLLALVRRYVGP